MCADSLPDDNANNLLKCVNIWQSGHSFPGPRSGAPSSQTTSDATLPQTLETTALFLEGSSVDPAAQNPVPHHCGVVVYSVPWWSRFPLFSGNAIGKVAFLLTFQSGSHLLFMLVVYLRATVPHKSLRSRNQPAMGSLSHLFFRKSLSSAEAPGVDVHFRVGVEGPPVLK